MREYGRRGGGQAGRSPRHPLARNAGNIEPGRGPGPQALGRQRSIRDGTEGRHPCPERVGFVTHTLTIGYSPCPNDTFIFYALIHGKVRVPGVEFRERLEDVETLNTLALQGSLDVTKISYHALGRLREEYALLRSGGALGRGCGPLIVARPGMPLSGLRH